MKTTLQPTDYPCWLTAEELEEALALKKLGFIYCGDANNFCEWDYDCGRVGSWNFGGASGEVCLDARCRGALYSKCLEISPQRNSNRFFEKQLAAAKAAIRSVKKARKKDQPQQLSLL